LDITTHTSLSPIWREFAPSFVNYKKWCTRLAAASDKVYQLLAHGWWFSPGTPASSTTKTGCHDIAESGVKHQNSLHLTDVICADQHYFSELYSACGEKYLIQLCVIKFRLVVFYWYSVFLHQ